MPDLNYNTGNGLTPVTDPRGVWVAYHHDSSGLSGVAAFPTEVEALRYALKGSLTVAFLEFGKDLADVDLERWREAQR